MSKLSKKEYKEYVEGRFVLLVRFYLWKYMEMTIEQFEEYLVSKSTGPDLDDVPLTRILKHYHKEIYPLEKGTVKWMMMNFPKEEIRFTTKFREMQKLRMRRKTWKVPTPYWPPVAGKLNNKK